MEYYDLGSYTRKVTTAVPDAQLWFDRGSPIPPAVEIVGPSRARGEGTMSGMAQGATGEGIYFWTLRERRVSDGQVRASDWAVLKMDVYRRDDQRLARIPHPGYFFFTTPKP